MQKSQIDNIKWLAGWLGAVALMALVVYSFLVFVYPPLNNW